MPAVGPKPFGATGGVVGSCLLVVVHLPVGDQFKKESGKHHHISGDHQKEVGDFPFQDVQDREHVSQHKEGWDHMDGQITDRPIEFAGGFPEGTVSPILVGQSFPMDATVGGEPDRPYQQQDEKQDAGNIRFFHPVQRDAYRSDTPIRIVHAAVVRGQAEDEDDGGGGDREKYGVFDKSEGKDRGEENTAEKSREVGQRQDTKGFFHGDSIP